MAGGFKVLADVVTENVRKFFTLEAQISQLKQRVATLRETQTSEVWPDIASVSAFRKDFTDAIARTEDRLLDLERELADCGRALEASARALEEQDRASAEALRQLVSRLGVSDATPGEEP